jgi:YVTN family beta-propeller protein
MHVVVQRRAPKNRTRWLSGRRGRLRVAVAGAAVLGLAVTGSGIALASTTWLGHHHVGTTTGKGLVLSDDQVGKPLGDRLVIDNGKIMASTVSPDGSHLAALTADGGIALTLVDLKKWTIQQRVGSAATADLKISDTTVGQQGPSYSPDGRTLWVPQQTGYARFPVNADGSVGAPTAVPIPTAGTAKALPAQTAFSADGSTVYATVNGQNRVVAIDAASGTLGRSWTVGTAPRGILRVGSKLYVSDEGGRAATGADTTINSYGTQVPADPKTGAATTGSVSVIDLAAPAAAVRSIAVGLHPTTVYAAGGAVFVTDTGSDDVSVIDPHRDAVVQTIATRPWPEAKVGYEPTGLTLTGDGHLLVTLGRANAVAVYRYTRPQEPVSYVGLLPTDYFPAAVNVVKGSVVVSNTRGIDALRADANGHNTHDTTSSLTRFKLPSDYTTRRDTATVFAQNGWTSGSLVPAGGRQAKPVPVPVRLGDPSTIKYVFLLVKENRTYDQQFGDIASGDGDPALTQFGADVTPNQHALTQQFGLYDNTYDAGTNSAEGHNWLMQADNPEYTESSAGEYLRSYDTEDDALGHQRSGTIWSGAQAVGASVRDFGEFNQFETVPAGATWGSYYCDALAMDATGAKTTIDTYTSSPIPSLNAVTNHAYPKFDTGIPDLYRYEIWKQDFQKNGPSNLNMFWLSSDHTGGPLSPVAQVADGDLATGKIIDTISHSKYWKQSAIFVVEDDSQAGQDHVDGHRAPIQVISPYARHGVVDDHYYSQITMVRTIEQILGIHPMNQKDTAATPMYTAFDRRPDDTPFTAVPNRTSLTLGLATEPACGWNAVAARYAQAQPSTAVPAAEQAVAAQWRQWKTQQHFTGPTAIPDFANPAQMNHLTWYETSGWTKPYPGESRVYGPSQVPGAYLPSADSDN